MIEARFQKTANIYLNLNVTPPWQILMSKQIGGEIKFMASYRAGILKDISSDIVNHNRG